jgi:NAD(P)-dependent dehydrogenase (short-subunit alcohol dehydrogenase family)
MRALEGKTCVMTGATAGIGRVAADHLVAEGVRLVVLARNPGKCRDTVASLNAAGPGHARGVVGDLASLADVRRMAAEVLETDARIDVFISCAAVITRQRALTIDGIETQLAVNHLAPFLLTTLLLERLRASAPSRIVIVASQVESIGRIDFSDLGRERQYDPAAAYAQSKLANVLFTLELARRLAGTGVTANCLHPGVYATQLLHDYFGRPRLLSLMTTFGNPGPAAGGRHLARLASDPALEGVTGRYFHEGIETLASPAARDEALAARLWSVSETIVHRRHG